MRFASTLFARPADKPSRLGLATKAEVEAANRLLGNDFDYKVVREAAERESRRAIKEMKHCASMRAE